MGSLRSWLGSCLCLALFFVVRRWTTGFALPAFVGLVFGLTYIWFVVLRVPELRKVTASVPEGTRKDASVSDTTTVPLGSSSAPVATSEMAMPPATAAVEKATSAATAPLSQAPATLEVEQLAALSQSDQGEPAVHTSSPNAVVAAQASGECVESTEGNSLLPPTPSTSMAVAAAGEAAAAEAAAAVAAEEATAAATATATQGPADAASVLEEQACREAERPTEEDEADAPSPRLPELDQEPRGEDVSEDSASDADELVQEAEGHFDAERSHELRLEGNEHFKAGRLYDAREAYSEALHLAPPGNAKDKAVLFSNRAACQQKLQRWDDMVADCKQAIDLDPAFVKPYSRRSIAFEQLGRWHDAHEDLKKAVELDPSLRSKEYKRMAFLENRAKEQFEKDKEEMVSKLKDLGNTVLGKFGMSCDNFKMEQDPETGSYSIKFQQ